MVSYLTTSNELSLDYVELNGIISYDIELTVLDSMELNGIISDDIELTVLDSVGLNGIIIMSDDDI